MNTLTANCREEAAGAKANRSGKTAEDTIYCLFKERGYTVQRQMRIKPNIYGHRQHVDFFIKGIAWLPDGLIIESKWQNSRGSTDEKFPYLVLNLKSTYPCPTIIMADGGGAKEGALDWLREQVDGEKLIGVFNFTELLTWIVNNQL
ncbi:MAG: hypothetical protein M9930_19985 [Anaerolineae bacterium]|nr:hypothetical protein [Anaerolineae bacterium]